jgi:membrane protease subunit (stomatin/prohibitin family)
MPLIRFSEPDARRQSGSENGLMDQGIAAAFAGVAGLVGAGIGGLATAYGARVGAQKALQAVQMQVQQQAAAEHSHWLRDQRRQVCSDITAAWAQVVMPSARCLSRIEQGQAIHDDTLHALGSHIDALADACAPIPLWGPDHLIARTTELREASSDFAIAIARWNDVREAGDQAAINAQQQLCETLKDDFASAHGRFLSAARTVLASPG